MKRAAVLFAVPVQLVERVVEVAIAHAGGATVGAEAVGFWREPGGSLLREMVKQVAVYIDNEAVGFLCDAVVEALRDAGELAVAYEVRYGAAAVVETGA